MLIHDMVALQLQGVKTEFLQHYRPTYELPAIQTFGGFVYLESFAKLKLNL